MKGSFFTETGTFTRLEENEFEKLLEKASRLLKNRRSQTDQKGTRTHEALQQMEHDSKI